MGELLLLIAKSNLTFANNSLRIFILLIVLIWASNTQAQDTFTYESNVDSLIPSEGNPGICDYTFSEFPTAIKATISQGTCEHDYNPPLIAMKKQWIKFYEEEGWYINKFRLEAYGLGAFVVDPSVNNLTDDHFSYCRTFDYTEPGYYYKFPASKTFRVTTTHTDSAFLDKIQKRYLKDVYYTNNLLDSIQSLQVFDNIKIIEFNAKKLDHNSIIDSTGLYYTADLGRREFFYETQSNGATFRFSGWYGKFAHIFTITELDSKKGFIREAKKYFNLPDLDINKVSYVEGIDEITGCYDYFYSYNDSDAGFKLYAYPFITSNNCEENSGDKYHDGVILDLTVFAEEE